MEITKISGATKEEIINRLESAFKKLGYDADIKRADGKITISNVRLSDRWIKEKGYNISPYTGRRGRVLGWKNWVEVNNMINKVLDELGVSANVRSLHGTFIIRKGMRKYTEEDWEERAWDNVGSLIQPVPRKYAWLSEKEYEQWKAKKLAEMI